MKLISPAALLLLLTTPVIAQDAAPADCVRTAVAVLQASPGYAWRITMEAGGRSRSSPGPIEGKTLKEGATQWAFHFGDRKVEAFAQSGRIVINTGDGWNEPAAHPENRGEKPPPPPPASEVSAPKPPPPPHDGRHGHKPPGHRGNKDGFFASRLRSMKTPGALSSELLAKVSDLKSEGTTITATLQPEAAAELLTAGSHSRDKGCIAEPQGTISWDLAGGSVKRIELQLSATFSFGDSKVPVSLHSRIEITETDLTRLDIPAEAARLLAVTPASKP